MSRFHRLAGGWRGSLLAQSTFLGIGRGTGKLLSFLSFILIARALGPDSYGNFAFILSVGSLLMFLPNMGADPYYSREVGSGKECPVGLLKSTLLLKLFGGALFVLLFPLIVWATGVGGATSGWTILFIALALLLLCFAETWRSVLVTAKKAGSAGLLDVAQAAVFLACAGLVIWRPSVQNAAAAFGVSQIVAVVIGALLVRQLLAGTRANSKRASLWSVMGSTLPLMTIWLLSDLYLRIDTTMLYLLKGETETGYYSASYRLVEGVYSATLVLAAVVLPRMAKAWGQGVTEWVSEWRKGSLVLVCLVGAPALLFWVWPEAIVAQLYGSEFSSSSASLRILGPATAVICFGCLQGVALTSMGLERYQLGITAGGLTANVGLNLWLIPQLGGVGAAWCTLFSGIVFTVLAQYRLQRTLRTWGAANTTRAVGLGLSGGK